MKKMILFAGISLVLVSFVSQGDAGEILNALKAANADGVSRYFDNQVALTLPGREEKNMENNQAAIALKSFFNENGIKGFELSSQREAGATMYIAGKLPGRNKSFNITLLLKNTDGKRQ